MRKLLYADIYQFLKNKIFWAEMTISAALAVFVLIANYSKEVQATADAIRLEEIFFIFYQMVTVLIAAGISLVVGTQYSDGTIRNKIVVGHTRGNIYFSTLTVCLLSSLAVIVIHTVFSYSIGCILFGKFGVPISQILVSLLYIVLNIMVLTAIFTACTMNIHNKAVSAVIAMLLALLLMYLAGSFIGILSEPEMTYENYVISMDGIELGEMIKNPAYVSGTRRKVIEFLTDLSPVGQIIQICDDDFTRSDRWPFFSAALFAVVSLLGFLRFKKHDIK